MATNKLSNGFGGSWTKQASDAESEIENRMSNPKEYLPDDGELTPGQNPNKLGDTQAKHDDFADIGVLRSAFNKKVQKSLAAAGNAKDQQYLDEIDAQEALFNQGIKPITSQLPMDDDNMPFMKNEHNLAAAKRRSAGQVMSKGTKYYIWFYEDNRPKPFEVWDATKKISSHNTQAEAIASLQ